MRRCRTCGELKPDDMYDRGLCRGGFTNQCKACKVVENRLRVLGITAEQYEEAWRAQEGKCALCGIPHQDRPHKRLHGDHNHETGEFRGLLCRTCNTQLGVVERWLSDAEWMEKVRIYLKRGQ